MNRKKWILTLLALLLMGSGAVVLAHYKSLQRLGEPGVKTRAVPGSKNLEVVLPENVLDFTSEIVAQAEIVTNTLPADTSYGQRRYIAPDKKFWATANVVLMGTDRASMHKPQFCLTGAGWNITKTEVVPVRISKPESYDLMVIKLTANTTIKNEGQDQRISGIYVYWFVTDKDFSASPQGWDRMISIGRNLLQRGVLQRWSYISFFAPCLPGQEEAAYEQVEKLIAASVPEFQIPHGSSISAQKP